MDDNAFPQPHPYTPPPGSSPSQIPRNLPLNPPAQPQFAQMKEQMSAIRIEGPTPEHETNQGGKEKKKFWGMSKPSWGGEKREKHRCGTPEDGSRFVEGFNEVEGSLPPSTQGHGATEEEAQLPNKLLGLDFGALRGRDQTQPIAVVDNVTAAIRESPPYQHTS